MLPHLFLSLTLLVFGLGTALLVGMISGVLPGIAAMRMRVVSALRKV
jgi:ABC-type antimicrobial peptide transport system permease subunit